MHAYIRTGFVALSLLFLVGFITPVHAAGLTEAQISAILSLLSTFGADASVVANVNATLHGQSTGGSTSNSAACVNLYNDLSLNATDSTTNGEVTKLQQFLGGRVTGYFGPATLQLVQRWQSTHGIVTSGDIYTTGYGAVGTKTRGVMACSGSNIMPSTPTGATIDQTSVVASPNAFTLTGSAVTASSVFVALVKSNYSGFRDWRTVYANHSYVAFTGDVMTPVSGNRWAAAFTGIPSGTYTVLVYDNSGATQSLLGVGALSVSAPSSFSYVAGSGAPITLGVGQTASNGSVKIKLTSVYLNNNVATANFQTETQGYNSATPTSANYTAVVGGSIPGGGGGLQDFAVASCGGISIKVSALSVFMNTATIVITPVCPG